MAEKTPEKLQDAIYWIGVNALRLRDDAELLHRAYRFPSAIFLSISCVEECVKYVMLKHSSSAELDQGQDLRRHDRKFNLAFLFSFQELIVSARDYYLSDPKKTKKIAQKIGIDGEEFLEIMKNIPDYINKDKLIEIMLDKSNDIMKIIHSSPIKEFVDTSGLARIRGMALYADLTVDETQLHLNHPMFFGEEFSSDLLKGANKASDFIRGTSERLAALAPRPLPFFVGAKV